MKRFRNVQWIVLALVLLIVLIPVSVLAREQRIALVIGNGAYEDSPLKNPVNDATDMASALKDLGFEVTLETNANQRVIEDSIRQFGEKLRPGSVGMFYFAGHGIQHRGKNYLIPIHANIKNEADVKYEAVDAGRVLAQMEDAGNGLNVIILDACRNNPFARSFRSVEYGLARMDAPVGSLLAYATAPGSVAHDGDGRNGLYTSKLLEHLKTPGLKLEDFFKRVRQDVVIQSIELGTKQIPWESSSVMIDFYLVNPSDSNTGDIESAGQLVHKLNRLERPSDGDANQNEKTKSFRLAILPWELKHDAPKYRDRIMDILLNVLKEFESIELKYSFYEIDRKHHFNQDKIGQEVLQILDRKPIFTSEGDLFSFTKVDAKLLRRLGKELSVDFIITVRLDIQINKRGYSYGFCELLKCYLYDVNRNTISEKSITNKSIAFGNFYPAVKPLFNSIILDYYENLKS